jgi:hypothetical protein
LSKVLSSTKPSDGQGFEGQRVARTGNAQVDRQQHVGLLGCFFFFLALLLVAGWIALQIMESMSPRLMRVGAIS